MPSSSSKRPRRYAGGDHVLAPNGKHGVITRLHKATTKTNWYEVTHDDGGAGVVAEAQLQPAPHDPLAPPQPS